MDEFEQALQVDRTRREHRACVYLVFSCSQTEAGSPFRRLEDGGAVDEYAEGRFVSRYDLVEKQPCRVHLEGTVESMKRLLDARNLAVAPD